MAVGFNFQQLLTFTFLTHMSNVNQGSMNIITEFATKKDTSIIVMLRTGVLFLYVCMYAHVPATYA